MLRNRKFDRLSTFKFLKALLRRAVYVEEHNTEGRCTIIVDSE